MSLGKNFFVPPSSSPLLRLVSSEELEQGGNRRGLSPTMTLSEFVEAFVVPVWLAERHDSELTIYEYRRSIEYWKQFTADPPLAQIDDFTTSQFMQGLHTLPGRAPKGKTVAVSPFTIRKHVGNVQTCLSLAGPKTSNHRKAQRLIEEVPYLERPAVDVGEVDDNFTLEEIAAILEGARHMRRPRIPRVPPPGFWRTMAIVTYNTGERRGALLKVPQPAPGDREIVFLRGIRKGRVHSNRVPLNEHARDAIESIRTDRELLFPWPHDLRWFARCWEKLLIFAGIPEERRFGLHGLRKATGTEMGAYSPLGAMQTLGHQQWSTYQRHYAGKKVKADAIAALPQPMKPRPGRGDDPTQKLLF